MICSALSRHYQLTVRCHRAVIERFLSGFSIEGFLLFYKKSSNEKTSGRIASHFHDNIAKRFLNGQTEPGAAKSGRWMSRTVCRRPARWAPFFSTWPGHWPTLVSPGSLSLSFSPMVLPLPTLYSHSTASVLCETVPPSSPNRASVERCVATTINDFHHRTGHHHRSSSKAPLMT